MPIESIAMFGVAAIDLTGYSERHIVVLLDQARQEVITAHAEYKHNAAQVRDSKRYTEEGKQQELGTLASNYLHRLNHAKLLESARTSLASLRAKITVTAAEPNDAARVMREIEIRDRLTGMDEARRIAVWFNAIDNGDTLTFDAIRNAPSFMELIIPDVLNQGIATWTEKRNPEHAKHLRDLSAAITALERAEEVARTSIANDAGVPDADPIALLAAS